MNNLLSQSLVAALLISGATFTVEASVVKVEYIGPPTGVSDGADYVLPYAITIDGNATSAICYDTFDTITSNQTWFANEFTLSEAVSSGFFPATSGPWCGISGRKDQPGGSTGDTCFPLGPCSGG